MPYYVCHSDLLSVAVAFINAVVLAADLGRCVIIVGAAAAADAHYSSQSRSAAVARQPRTPVKTAHIECPDL